jgi:hypothetical protein
MIENSGREWFTSRWGIEHAGAFVRVVGRGREAFMCISVADSFLMGNRMLRVEIQTQTNRHQIENHEHKMKLPIASAPTHHGRSLPAPLGHTPKESIDQPPRSDQFNQRTPHPHSHRVNTETEAKQHPKEPKICVG